MRLKRPDMVTVCAVVGAVALFNIFNDTITHLWGSSSSRHVMNLFAVLLAVRLFRSVAPRNSRWRALMFRQKATLLVVIAVMGVLLMMAMTQTIRQDFRRLRHARVGFHGESDETILRNYTEWNHFYPRETFLQEAKAAIPESDSVLYVGDLRPDSVNLALYPRKVYALPELQLATLRNVQVTWTVDDDPNFANSVASQLISADIPRDRLRQEIRDLVTMKDIRWVIHVDQMHPEQSEFRRIAD